MAERITATKAAHEAGFESLEAALESATFDSICPACCSEGCEVEPDGTCEHGFPSILLAMGMI